MGLSNLRVPSDEVKVPGSGAFSVRGLNLQDIQYLVARHSGQMGQMFELFKSEDNLIGNAAMVSTIFIDKAPAMAADVIALAADSPSDYEKVIKLPFPVQVDALSKIAHLTFTSEDSLKKFIATVRSAMQVMLKPMS